LCIEKIQDLIILHSSPLSKKTNSNGRSFKIYTEKIQKSRFISLRLKHSYYKQTKAHPGYNAFNPKNHEGKDRSYSLNISSLTNAQNSPKFGVRWFLLRSERSSFIPRGNSEW